jgi:hypothetical protein
MDFFEALGALYFYTVERFTFADRELLTRPTDRPPFASRLA